MYLDKYTQKNRDKNLLMYSVDLAEIKRIKLFFNENNNFTQGDKNENKEKT